VLLIGVLHRCANWCREQLLPELSQLRETGRPIAETGLTI